MSLDDDEILLPPMLSTGGISNLGAWRDLTAAVFGEDSAATKFWDAKIAKHAKGRDEWVVSDERQTLYLVMEIDRQGRGNE